MNPDPIWFYLLLATFGAFALGWWLRGIADRHEERKDFYDRRDSDGRY